METKTCKDCKHRKSDGTCRRFFPTIIDRQWVWGRVDDEQPICYFFNNKVTNVRKATPEENLDPIQDQDLEELVADMSDYEVKSEMSSTQVANKVKLLLKSMPNVWLSFKEIANLINTTPQKVAEVASQVIDSSIIDSGPNLLYKAVKHRGGEFK
jgi:hypothetical protein